MRSNRIQSSCESAPILNGEQHETIEDSKVALNGKSASHSYSIGLRSGLTRLTRVLGSAYIEWPRQRGIYQLFDEVK